MIEKQKYYNGIKNLRDVKTKVELPKNYMSEMKRCKDDIVYFAEHYFYIVNADRGKILIELHPFQKIMLQNLVDNQNNVFNCSRQIGKTTIVKIYIVWYILFHTDKKVGVASYIEKSSIKILSEIKYAYIELPLWMQFSVLEWNVKSISLANGCMVLTSATTGNTFRGEAINFLYVDETAIIPNQLWAEFEDSVLPTISSAKTSRVAYTSTPKGFNHFFQICEDARNKVSDFTYFEAKWDAVPGRDENWKRTTKSKISGFNKDKLFAQNYECAFVSEDSTFLSSDILRQIHMMKPINKNKANTDYDDILRIYKEPISDENILSDKFKKKNEPNYESQRALSEVKIDKSKHHTYVLGVDVASGKGGDMSAIVVLDITFFPFEVVAVYVNNEISTLDFAIQVKFLSEKYNDALCVIESNTYGLGVIEYLIKDLDFYNIIRKDKEWGFYTSTSTKRILVETIQNTIQYNKIIINDFDIFIQLTKFVKRKNGTYGAMTGYHDDLVMALGMALMIMTTNYYEGETYLEMFVGEKVKEDESYGALIIGDTDNGLNYSGFNGDDIINRFGYNRGNENDIPSDWWK